MTETNWRPTVASGLGLWVAVVIGAVTVPSTHPLIIGVAATALAGGVLLPVALVGDYRQARAACGRLTTTTYAANLARDGWDSLRRRTPLGAQRRLLAC